MNKGNLLKTEIQFLVNKNQGTDMYFIAEIGINHNGDIKIAKQLIERAKKIGCDAVKFQKRDISTVYSENELKKERQSPWGNTNREQKEGLEFGKAEYDVINEYCKELGIDWTASAWDSNSLKFIEEYKPKFHKIASAFITNLEFLEQVALLHRITLISTGMSTMQDVEKAVSIFKKYNTPFILLHTVSTYPSPENTLNLRMINTLETKFGVNVGYSGHESSMSPTLTAIALGARVIERHITLDRAMYGTDQSASLEINGFEKLIQMGRKIPLIVGDGVKKFEEEEKVVAKKLRYWE
jgi:N-acetylneuraminate synthase